MCTSFAISSLTLPGNFDYFSKVQLTCQNIFSDYCGSNAPSQCQQIGRHAASGLREEGCEALGCLSWVVYTREACTT